MRISHFFIDRPIFAAVISVIITILGAVSFLRLPIAQYPEIAPPLISVTGQYPGASAEVVASTVVTPIEQQINGVENMIYIASNSTADGRFSIAVSFELGTNLDIAQVQVQNRVAIANPRLPADVRNIGVTVQKASPDLMMVVHLYSPDKSRDMGRRTGGVLSTICSIGHRSNQPPERYAESVDNAASLISVLILTGPLPPKLPPITCIEDDAGSVAMLCKFTTQDFVRRSTRACRYSAYTTYTLMGFGRGRREPGTFVNVEEVAEKQNGSD